ncbi:MAG: protecting protein DprA [Marmoricola sp.]|nr:protecting protein DprA [Marmoricola sp.]
MRDGSADLRPIPEEGARATGVTEAERLARVVLSRIAEPGDPRMTTLVHDHGAEVILAALRGQADQAREAGSAGGGSAGEGEVKVLGRDLADRLTGVDPERELARAADRGMRFVVPGDREWPVGLDDLVHAPLLHERGGVPVGLWCRGPLRLDEAAGRAVAVVGSRSATTYGADVATELASVLAREGWTTVSGAAFGIDQAAHRGALAQRGPTVAVLASGADRAYPTAHRALIDYVADVGLVVSEAAPGCAPTRIRFLARNRLIAGLARGTVVVEAAVRSGALNTASWAAGLGRPVMGVPGPVTSAPSAGVHQLVRARDALLVTRGEEVLEVVGAMGETVLEEPRGPETPRDRLGARGRQVLDAVPLVRPATTAAVARAAGLGARSVEQTLVTLLEAGVVVHVGGRWRVAPDLVPSDVGDQLPLDLT